MTPLSLSLSLSLSVSLCLSPPQDVTHKIVEAIGTIAGSSLEQTTWLRRNLEVKASPQIVVEGASLETDVEGRHVCVCVCVGKVGGWGNLTSG